MLPAASAMCLSVIPNMIRPEVTQFEAVSIAERLQHIVNRTKYIVLENVHNVGPLKYIVRRLKDIVWTAGNNRMRA
jgi:hypothetical protein